MNIGSAERHYLEHTIPTATDDALADMLNRHRRQIHSDRNHVGTCLFCQWSSLVVRTIGDEYVKRRLPWPTP